jgi:hypothetical protein
LPEADGRFIAGYDNVELHRAKAHADGFGL